VDDTLRTTAAHIWAVGDCVGELLFTHVASYHGAIVGHNMFAKDGDLQRYDGSVIPWATFTEPPLARVGLTEREARDKFGDVRVARLEFSDIERAHIILEDEGMMKVVSDADKRIVGATILGPHADELIHELALAVKLGLRAGDVRSLIHAYPTLAEGVREVVNRL
jgi:pyruvate/2-oxoglutarate dehydrogenase complex dihydrolipoamide dehydrogenase (E3) component